MSGSMMHLRSPGHPVWAEEAHADAPDSSPPSPKSYDPSPTPFQTVRTKSVLNKQSVDSIEVAEFKLLLCLLTDLVSIS